MALLKKAVNETAFLKAGLLGFPGSGKTYSAGMLAIGIIKRLGDGRPIAFFDTEAGSDFLIPKFDAEGIEMQVAKSLAFADLLAVGKEAEATCSVLIVDSITHVWRELCEAYQRRKKVNRLEFQHWADIKREWAAWTSFYLNSRLHIFVCGRAGFEWDFEADSDGKKQLIKVGTKMRVESEFGFEPSLLIEMERVSKGAEPGSGWLHRAHILKDRTDTINGAAIDFQKPRKAYVPGDWQQTFKPFQPVFDAHNIGGVHHVLDTDRTSDAMFSGPGGESLGAQRARRATIACEEIQGSLVALWPGQDAESKRLKMDIIEGIFGTRSWTAVEAKPVETLERAAKMLKLFETEWNRDGAEHGKGSAIALLQLCDDRLKEAETAASAATAGEQVAF